MTEDKLYLNSDLTLRNLANHLDIHPNQLSWLINDQYNKNFKEFINSYRVDHFKQLVKTSTEKQLYLIGLAYESGFNSKTAFNAFFKKHTGITPSQFVKQQLNSQN
jgi:AraC-like DNA-binding protein